VLRSILIMKYFFLWWKLTLNVTQTVFAWRIGTFIFLIGKFLRFGFFFFFLFILIGKAKTLAGYSAYQVFFFYLTFNLIDGIPQFLFREVYRFRQYVISGNFDYFLLNPISALFRSLFGVNDILDIPLNIIVIIMLFYVGKNIPGVTIFSTIAYIFLLLNALLIAASFHICVLCLGIITTEVDNAIMLYRDFTQMGRFPIDIYKQPLQGVLTFVIPIGIMMTIPAKVMMGIFNLQIIVVSFSIGILLFSLSLLLWKYSLRSYSSASS